MADRRTRDALLRMRRVAELDAQRSLTRARTELERAQLASERAATKARAAESKLSQASAEPTRGAAGRLATRERFLDRLRSARDEARKRAAAAAHATVEAESLLRRAQETMQTALRARESSETHEAALALRAQRQVARREESASQDRWRKGRG